MPQYRYVCKNPNKYAGDTSKIFGRSRWELIYMQALDTSPIVLKWISEPKSLGISYISPIDKRVHTYWPDFLVQYVNGVVELIEIKPLKEALLEKAGSDYDKLMLIKNAAKWAAADAFAKKIGARFRVVTEQQLFKPKATKQPRIKTYKRGTKK